MDKDFDAIVSRKTLALLEEDFEKVHGYFLDEKAPFFLTLDGISASGASEEFDKAAETVAGHVDHVVTSLQYVQDFIREGDLSQYVWGKNWGMKLDEAGWEELKLALRREYDKLRDLVKGQADWLDKNRLDVMMGTIAHCAYHLAIVRQHL
jgi:hypothetical protein